MTNENPLNAAPTTPQEFLEAKPITRIFGWSFDKQSDTAYFNLLGVDQNFNQFKCTSEEVRMLAIDMASISFHAERFKKDDSAESIMTYPFDPQMVMAALRFGNGTTGSVQLYFFNSNKEAITMILGREQVNQLNMSFNMALDALPQRPAFGGTLDLLAEAGSRPTLPEGETETETYFGHEYPVKILKALGLLVMRANLLDRELLRLFERVSGFPQEKANALYFSVSNNHARARQITALLPMMNIGEEKEKKIRDAIKRTERPMELRNALIHGDWKFEEKGPVVYTQNPTAPNAANREKQVAVNAEYILDIAAQYKDATLAVQLAHI